MNLSAYDIIKGTPTKSKIYLHNNYPYIVTREVKKRKYYCFVKRYEPSIDDTILYLVLLDDNPPDRAVAKTRQDDYGRLKFNLSILGNIFHISQNSKLEVELTLETAADDGDIYKIEIKSD